MNKIYKILSKGEVIDIIHNPNFIKIDNNNNYVISNIEEAEGISIKGKVYNIRNFSNRLDKNGIDEIDIVEIDFNEFMEYMYNKFKEYFLKIENALCELDSGGSK